MVVAWQLCSLSTFYTVLFLPNYLINFCFFRFFLLKISVFFRFFVTIWSSVFLRYPAIIPGVQKKLLCTGVFFGPMGSLLQGCKYDTKIVLISAFSEKILSFWGSAPAPFYQITNPVKWALPQTPWHLINNSSTSKEVKK